MKSPVAARKRMVAATSLHGRWWPSEGCRPKSSKHSQLTVVARATGVNLRIQMQERVFEAPTAWRLPQRVDAVADGIAGGLLAKIGLQSPNQRSWHQVSDAI